ncbi:4Fe-4S binding protein [Desulfococcaceae bacterium HSG7]|nr:4Fe-4S binding protein [Desulfococcaceae bacterium HSG7]
MAGRFSETGYLTEEDLRDSPGFPSVKKRRQGFVAVIECIEDIPCNPCESSCKTNAITVGDDITHIPHLNEENCIGCRTCVFICPGQAIFMVDESLTDGKAAIMMPYEYLPLPQKGDIVNALDRAGQKLGKATVVAVRKTKKMDHTATVTIETPIEWSTRARMITPAAVGN